MKKMMLGMACAFFAQLFSVAHAQPSFSQQFQPDTIGPGSHTELLFTIDNQNGAAITDMAFTNNLPAGLSIGSLSSNSCQGNLTAPNGGSTITLTDGTLGASQNCSISVSVVGSTIGTHINTSGDLTSSAGNSGTSTDDLTVADDRPSITMSFSPNAINSGSPSTLTYTVDNSANPDAIYNLQLTQQLPPGLVFGLPDLNTSDCPSSLMIDHQSQSFSIPFDNNFQNTLAAGASCALTVNVVGVGNQSIKLKSSDLTTTVTGNFQPLNSGFAKAVIDVVGQELQVSKSFVNDPTVPGSTVQVDYQLTLLNRNDSASDINFTDDFGALVAGTQFSQVVNNTCSASVTGTGSGMLSFSSGSLAAEQSCQLSIQLTTSSAAISGTYLSTSSNINYQINGQNASSASASANWVIEPSPQLTMAFLSNPVIAGNSTDIEYTITNTSSTSAATDVTFLHQIVPFLPFPANATFPANDFCGVGSSASMAFIDTDQQGIQVLNGQLNPAGMPGDSCTFVVTVDIPAFMPTNTYDSATQNISATVGGTTRVGLPASDQLQVLNAPAFRHNFVDDPVIPGDSVTLEYEIILPAESPSDASDLSFTHDLDAVLSGLTATGLPINVCGGSITGTNLLTFTGGTLQAGDTCVFDVTLQVPAAATLGTYPSATSGLSATVSGISLNGPATTNELQLSAIDFQMNIIPGQVVAAEQNVAIEFTIDNLDPNNDASAIFFTNNLTSVIANWAGDGVIQNDICGMGSQLSGTTFLIFTGGTLSPSTSCTFSINTTIPVATASNLYNNITSNLSATINGSALTIDPATDTLDVIDGLSFSQQFIDDPVAPGGTVTLEFTIQNNAMDAVNGITFTNDLDATLTGMVATGLPINDVCGTGAQLTGTNLLTLTGGNLAASGNCTFNVTLQTPANATLGNQHINTTSAISGTLNGAPVSGPASSDALSVFSLELTKSFQGSVYAGQMATLDFQLFNLSNNPKQGISFSDDLNAMIPGAVAVGLPVNGSCGNLSQLSGTNTILFNQGELPAASDCQFSVQVHIPTATPPGNYINTTSMLNSFGLADGGEATATLRVNSAPAFSMLWTPDVINLSQVSQASFTIDNSASTLAASQLSFTNNLPVGLTVATPNNASSTCTGGTLTAVSGTTTINYTGGSVSASGSCIVSVDVAPQNSGQFINTSGDLTSIAGNSGPASDTLTVEGAPAFSKAFNPTTAILNEVVNLTFTIDNSANSLATTNLDFTDNFPAGMTVATPPNANTTCTGGTLTATSGSASAQYSGGSIAANSSCTVSIDVSSATMGLNQNVSGNLTSSGGNSGVASADLTISGLPVFSQSFAESALFVGQETTLTFDIDNSATPSSFTGLSFTNNLPAGITVATPNNLSNSCGGTVNTNGSSIDLSNGTVNGNNSCEISVSITAQTAGQYNNITSTLVTDFGTVAAANANVDVFDLPAINKSFDSAQAVEGSIIQVMFTINNPSNMPLTAATFSDDLGAFISGATALGLPQSNVCGASSSVTGTSVILATDLEIPAQGQCQITVDVQLPSSVTGAFTNTTSAFDFSSNGQNFSGPANSAGSAPITIIQGGPPAMVPVNQWYLMLTLVLLTLLVARRKKIH
ncbi:beta strand repeat-containing protein [Marinicella rhabdoformis]|uniref:beta strand repeat-containing protein n=1 Tax=Marinicella rhabdoformis TaxID=2580566 RepID=UPI0012AEBA33|nr:hypothetical protein [Marinicella rhabdoformis]